ncbi:MAG: hypothetical protein ACKV19_04030 [Verrucomicrobiales bacterium]
MVYEPPDPVQISYNELSHRLTRAGFNMDARPLWTHVIRCANQIAAGKHVPRRSLINAEFIEGSTIGPAPGR